ncbi:MAG TPA: hypothetical protein VFN65_03935 [Solirubrobacteraceae bacterium]|nr:hypothetical protein [Solirubrobacteraceae bacterium]
MLLRHRSPEIDTAPVTPAAGLEYLQQEWLTVLRWLNSSRVDYVLIGPVAHAIRGELTSRGPVGIVPAPYLRNYERLAAALTDQGATLRSERPLRGADPRTEMRLDAEKLAHGRRWLLHFCGHDLDVESSKLSPASPPAPGSQATGGPAGDGARYQELLYEAMRVEVAEGLSVQVASPEDLELYSHMRRTGVAPEFRITRAGAGAELPAGQRSDS